MSYIFNLKPLTQEQFLEYIDTIQETGFYRRANWKQVLEKPQHFQKDYRIPEIFKKRKQEAIEYWKGKF